MSGVTWLRALESGILRPYQTPIYRDVLTRPLSCVVGARQIGKSFALGAAAVVLAAYGVDGPAHDVLIISAREETAAHLIRSVRRHLRALDVVHRKVADSRYPSLDRIVLSNGRYIQAHPGPEALQGFTGSVIADEWSLLCERHDPEEILAQMLSVASSADHYRIAIASNADYAGTWLDAMVSGSDARSAEFAPRLITIHDAYPDGLPAHLERVRRTITPREWAKFFECRFLPRAEGMAFQRADIARSAEAFVRPERMVRVLSIDPGFTRDATGWVLADVGDGRVDVIDAGHDYGAEAAVVAMVRHGLNYGGVRRVYLDPGGPGFQLHRDLANEGVPLVAAGFNDRVRDEHIRRLERMVANGRLRVTARALVDDLECIERAKDGFSLPYRSAPVSGRRIHCDAAAALIGLLSAPETQTSSAEWINLRPVRDTSLLARALR